MADGKLTGRLSMEKKVAATLRRLLPRLEERFKPHVEPDEWQGFEERLRRNFPQLFEGLHFLYGDAYDFFFHVESILVSATHLWLERPSELKALDALREYDPQWYQSNRMVGAMCYVDLFSDDLQGLIDQIPYLTELGITYLHLMPLFESPEGDNDGGYAVSSYRSVNPELGTMEDLQRLATELRHRGISLVLDFVFNHTSDEHEWAQKALAGDEDYQHYYLMFPDRTMPNAYEASIRAVFPDEIPGCFSYRTSIKKWVWTSFYNFQWDLNYENPEVFVGMMESMLFLANQGVEVLRLDAIAFTRKELGTGCQNLPGAHVIVQAFNALKNIAAPAMAFKSEAIVHPDEVRKYISKEECELSYNPQLMSLLWEALATQDTRVLRRSMERGFAIDPKASWVNYVRCHDDIGWGFADEDVAAVGFDPVQHRRFLSEFYTGKFAGSFASGEPFQEDKETGEARVSGTCASLAGLEKAIAENNEEAIEWAIRRILLLHGVVMTIGGIPLIYLGDELGMLNNYTYKESPDKMGDSRWLHRMRFDWEASERRGDFESIEGRIYGGFSRLVQLRRQNLAFSRAETEFVESGNAHVFAYFRTHESLSVLVMANFSNKEQAIEAWRLRQLGLRKTMVDLVSGKMVVAARELVLEPYDFCIWARPT